MRRIRLTLDYIGTVYSGWQRQPDRDTVQKRVEDALFSLTGGADFGSCKRTHGRGRPCFGTSCAFRHRFRYTRKKFYDGA